MRLIGLTGGIASGKSTVAGRLASHGAVVVDADALAREVVRPGAPALAEIQHMFGDEVIGSDGGLDRAALGAIVFSDPAKRLLLNNITHPAVWRRARELFAAAEAADPAGVIVYDVPLLGEAAADRPISFDLVVVVHTDADVRIDRLVTLRGMTPADASARLAAQATDAERLALADVVIDANGTLEDTLEQVDALWDRVTSRR